MAEAVISDGLVAEHKRRPFFVELLIRLVREKPLGTIGGVIVLVLFLTGIFADVLAPYGMNAMKIGDRLMGPSISHLLGTDNLGRDLLSRVIFGARISMIVGLSVSTINVTISTFIGIISGFFGGKVDTVIQRFVDAWMAFPVLVILLTVLSITGPGMAQVIFVLGVSGGISGSRVIRSAVIAIRENMYLEAARAIGAPTVKILLRHVLPNIMAPIIVIFTIHIGSAIITEASLSFLGFGIPPPFPSWGGMISGAGRQYMLQAPWIILWPGVALAIVVYGINMLGDALRDLLDPRLRGGLGRYTVAQAKRRKALSRT